MNNKYVENYNNLVQSTNMLHYSENGIHRFLEFINESQEPICVCGSGTSYIVAEGIAKTINHLTGIITFPKRPRDFLYYNRENIKRMLFVSFSNNRIEYEQLKHDTYHSIILSYYRDNANNCDNISITNYSKDHQLHKLYFNSPQAALIPLEFVYYCLTKKKINSFAYWNEKLNEKIDIKEKTSKIAIICGDNCELAAKDFKNKFEESIYGSVDIYEKRDFAHGKFLGFNVTSYSMIIYFQQNRISKYEEALLNYLKSNNKIVIIQSRYYDIEAEIDLLQAEQTFFCKLCIQQNIDFGNAYVDENSNHLFNYSLSII